jgi:uncharacterized surface protein with fasciclin (FAS1) repeats
MKKLTQLNNFQNNFFKSLLLSLFLLISITNGSRAESDSGIFLAVEETPATVVDIIVGSDVHTTLAVAVTEAGLVDALTGEGPFTVFAPTDEAFAALPEGTVEALLEDPAGLLTDILLYHVVGAAAFSTDLENGQMVETLYGQNVTVTINDDGVFINNAQVIIADLEAGNGVVHVIDAVLIPAEEEETPATVVDIIVGSDVHTTLAVAVTEAGLVDALTGEGPFTVFAPTDEAFAALPEGTVEALLEDPAGLLTDILLYHVVGAAAFSTDLENGQMVETLYGQNVTVTINDDGVFINNAQVIIADLAAGNGVVHVIDAVLIPAEEEETPATVVDIIVGSDVHTTLAVAVTEAGLVDALTGEGPFTVFAPTDEAFAALPEGTVEALLEDPAGLLTDILLYHVVGAAAFSTDLENGQMVETLYGQNVTVTINDDGVFINNAQVIIADLAAGNGVVHVIDAVLIPAEEVPTNVNNPAMQGQSDLNIYPNPARSNVNIDFQLRTNQRVNMDLYSMIGTRVFSRDLGILSAGSHSISQGVDGLYRGIYFVVMNLGNERLVSKLQVNN